MFDATASAGASNTVTPAIGLLPNVSCPPTLLSVCPNAWLPSRVTATDAARASAEQRTDGIMSHIVAGSRYAARNATALSSLKADGAPLGSLVLAKDCTAFRGGPTLAMPVRLVVV